MAGLSRPRSREEDGLRSTIANLDKQVDKYENEELLRLARGEIPLDELKAVAEALQESDASLCYEDALAEALVKWFKPTYFKWIGARWVHMDSCENARDQHLLYDVGWGKKQSYILAFSTEGAQDVSRAYIKDYDAALSRRNRMSEDDLQSVLAEVTRKRRAKLERKRLAELEQEDEWQAKFLRGEPSSTSQGEAEADLGPRQSGTAEWKAARGEDGKHD
ncbi:hypothetical protein FRC17_006166 [Serendipita sp. 399]|nr:hypothetical protein FRC17_006166 [Serendipita sp. 399]